MFSLGGVDPFSRFVVLLVLFVFVFEMPCFVDAGMFSLQGESSRSILKEW